MPFVQGQGSKITESNSELLGKQSWKSEFGTLRWFLFLFSLLTTWTLPKFEVHDFYWVNSLSFYAVKSKRTRSLVATPRVWPSRSASVSSLRGRRFPTRSKRRANSWSWRTSSTPSSKSLEVFLSLAPPGGQHHHYHRRLGGADWGKEKKTGHERRCSRPYHWPSPPACVTLVFLPSNLF